MGQTRARSRTASKKTNVWGFLRDVTIKVIDTFYNLCNSGNIFAAFVLIGFCEVFYLSYKLPPEKIDVYILRLIGFLGQEKFYIIPLSFTVIISLGANYYQWKVYTMEIKRLTDLRKELIHGLRSGVLRSLPKHLTSRFDLSVEEGRE